MNIRQLNEKLEKFLREDYELYVIETNDEGLYYLFGQSDNKPIEIGTEDIEDLENYLLEDEDGEGSRMDVKEVKEMFDKIKELLKKYKKVCVKLR